MEEVENLIKICLSEIERMLTTKTVVGEPMTVEGNTLIPLVSIGFGFGGGGGTGKGPKDKGEGVGGGTGGGGGIKPVGVIVVNKEGVRIEPIKGGAATFAEKVADIVGKVMEERAEAKKAEKKEG
ncbi:hypothetical protein ES703_47617 [subsurface metagenome]